MNLFNRNNGDTRMAQKVTPFAALGSKEPNETPTAFPRNGDNVQVDLNGDYLNRSYYSVEEPFVVSDAIPRGFSASKELAPMKSALNLFNTFEEASAWAQKINRPLVILEIKPAATCKPQMAAIEKIKA